MIKSSSATTSELESAVSSVISYPARLSQKVERDVLALRHIGRYWLHRTLPGHTTLTHAHVHARGTHSRGAQRGPAGPPATRTDSTWTTHRQHSDGGHLPHGVPLSPRLPDTHAGSGWGVGVPATGGRAVLGPAAGGRAGGRSGVDDARMHSRSSPLNEGLLEGGTCVALSSAPTRLTQRYVATPTKPQRRDVNPSQST